MDAHTRYVSCYVCGKGFLDDCGDVFCSSSCEEQHEREYAICEQCGEEKGEDNLVDGICWSCEKENEEE